MSTITGKSALVTGGGSGIGFGTARHLAADGARVTICGRTEDKLAKAVEAITPEVGEGGSIRYVVADVTVEDQVAEAVDVAVEEGGGSGLDVLFANEREIMALYEVPSFEAAAHAAATADTRSRHGSARIRRPRHPVEARAEGARGDEPHHAGRIEQKDGRAVASQRADDGFQRRQFPRTLDHEWAVDHEQHRLDAIVTFSKGDIRDDRITARHTSICICLA